MMVDLSSFETIASAEIFGEEGGSSLVLKMKNGAVLHIAPDYDVMAYFSSTAEYDSVDPTPTVSVLCDCGGGMGPKGELAVMHDGRTILDTLEG